MNNFFRAWRSQVRFIGVTTLFVAVLSCTGVLALDSLSSDYRKLTCPQLEQEGRAISKRGFALSGLEAGLGGVDGTKTSPAIVIVWPSAAPVGDGKRSETLTVALKQMEAVEQASIASQCSIRFQREPSAP
jgi:hypothetical protein